MTKKELEDLVQRQSEQISELLEELKRRPQKEFVPVYPTQPSNVPTASSPYPFPSPWNWPTYPPQTWLSTSDGTEFDKVMNELKRFSGTKVEDAMLGVE